MASRPSEALELLAVVEEAARRGDWRMAATLAPQLNRLKVPAGPEELGRYLERLRAALVTAKSSRAHLIAALRRVNAAAGFSRARPNATGKRQNFVDSAEL